MSSHSLGRSSSSLDSHGVFHAGMESSMPWDSPLPCWLFCSVFPFLGPWQKFHFVLLLSWDQERMQAAVEPLLLLPLDFAKMSPCQNLSTATLSKFYIFCSLLFLCLLLWFLLNVCLYLWCSGILPVRAVKCSQKHSFACFPHCCVTDQLIDSQSVFPE